MRKKALTFLLALVMCLSLSTPAMASSPTAADTSGESPVVSGAAAEEIFSRYSEEIAFAENFTGKPIARLTQESIDRIKYTAAVNLDDRGYAFSELMTFLARACAAADHGMKPAGAQRNITVMAPNGILAGMHVVDQPTGNGTRMDGTAIFTLKVGDKAAGVRLSTGFSRTFDYSIVDPVAGETLHNGAIATHRTCFAVLYGTVLEISGRRMVEPRTAIVVPYTLLASIGVPTYCEQALHGGTWYFPGPYEYRSAFTSHPSPFI